MSTQQQAVLVIDNGASQVRAGYNQDYEPTVSVPTIVGKNRYAVHMPAVSGYKAMFVGRELNAKKGYAALTYPIQQGLVTDWDGLENIWRCIFQDLNKCSYQYPVFLTETTRAPTKQRWKMAEIMFEHFNVPALYLGDRLVMSLLATAHTSGIVLRSGGDMTQSMAVFDGHALPYTASNVNVNGKDIDHFFSKLMELQGYKFKTLTNQNIVQDIKKLCYVSQDFEGELYSKNHNLQTLTHYELPDGNQVSLTDEVFVAPEAFFRPTLLCKQSPSIQDAIENSIRTCHRDIQNRIVGTIVLAGGSTLFPGFERRLQLELSYRNTLSKNASIIAPTDRHLTSWFGATVLASLPSFPQMWVTNEDYKENGASVINCKCF